MDKFSGDFLSLDGGGLSIICASGEQKVVNLALGFRLMVEVGLFSDVLEPLLICKRQLEPPVCCSCLTALEATRLPTEGLRGRVAETKRWWWCDIA